VRPALAVVVVVAAACKSDPPAGPPAPTPPPAPVVDAADWRGACEAALKSAGGVTPARRVMHVIAGCRPCGDWTPLLEWNTPGDRGGPSREAIAAAMDACSAYCDDTARQRFLGGLDDARGQARRGPWKALGEVCKDAVSAVPDARFMSAPYFALDRIARALARDPKLAALANVTLPLPALSVSGVGYDLPGSPVTKPEAGPLQLTITASELRIGTLPQATLAGGKVTVDPLATSYPGTLASMKELAAAIDKLAADNRAARISVIAPGALPAGRLIEAVAAAGPRTMMLTVSAGGAPPGWTLPGTIPVTLGSTPDKSGVKLELSDATLDATLRAIRDLPQDKLTAPPTIAIAKATTVATVAKLLGTIAFRGGAAAVLVRAK
jgi:hypothetical protein